MNERGEIMSSPRIALPGVALAALLLWQPAASADDRAPEVRTLTYQRPVEAGQNAVESSEADAADTQLVRHRRGWGRRGGFYGSRFGYYRPSRGFSFSIGIGRPSYGGYGYRSYGYRPYSYGYYRPYSYGYGYRPHYGYGYGGYGGYGWGGYGW